MKAKEETVKKTWEAFYSDRRPWDKLEPETRQEFIDFFSEYEKQKFHEKANTIITH